MLVMRINRLMLASICLCVGLVHSSAQPYDPDDKIIESVVPKDGIFEAFYPREMYGIQNGASRAPHSHGSFFKYRHPALVEARNSAAYGYRFDSKRRFNFD